MRKNILSNVWLLIDEPELPGHDDSEESGIIEAESGIIETANASNSNIDGLIDNGIGNEAMLHSPGLSSVTSEDQQTSPNGSAQGARSVHSKVHSSGEWMKAMRLIKVANNFQRRLKKGARSFSDPNIQIPNEFYESLERQR